MGNVTCAPAYGNQPDPASAKKNSISISFSGRTAYRAAVKFGRAPIRYLCAFLLICAGAGGILFSPSIGLLGGKEVRSFTMSQVQEYPWGAAIASSELELP